MNDQLVARLTEKIWAILTQRQFRYGALPSPSIKNLIFSRLFENVQREEPIRVFQFWGGAKNPNLDLIEADECELRTLKRLYELHLSVKNVYSPGLSITLFPGDERIHKANLVPKAHTQVYIQTLTTYANLFEDLFSVVPVSYLYEKYASTFHSEVTKATHLVSEVITSLPNFEKLVKNASHNIFIAENVSPDHLQELSTQAAKTYIIYRLAEENTRIFKEYEDCIRFSFVKLSLFFQFYDAFLDRTKDNFNHMKRALHFFAGYKGNITQPWQAKAVKKDGRVLFYSQSYFK